MGTRLRSGVLQGGFDDKGVEAGRVLSPIAKNLGSKPKIAPAGKLSVSYSIPGQLLHSPRKARRLAFAVR